MLFETPNSTILPAFQQGQNDKNTTSVTNSSPSLAQQSTTTTTTTKRMKLTKCAKLTWWIAFWLFISIGWATIVALFGYLRATPVNPNNPDDYRKDDFVGSTYTVDKGYPALIIHVVGGVLSMLIGIVQFQQFSRKKMIIHRILGYLFAVFIVIGFVGSLWLIPYSAGGVTTKVAFSLLSLIWIGTLGMALFYVSFAKKNPFLKDLTYSERIQCHREWMIRGFSAICASITLRIYLFVFGGLYMAGNPTVTLDESHKEVYGAAAWLSMCGNLLISEIYINMVVRKKKGQQKK